MFFYFLTAKVGFGRMLVSVLLSAAANSWAQGTLSLAEAQRIAVARALQLTAQDASISAMQQMALAARQLPDPVLKVGIDNLPVEGPDNFNLDRDFMTMRRIGLMQEVPREEKRQLKSQRFEVDSQRVQAEKLVTIAAVRRDTALAWLDRYYGQATRDLLMALKQETDLQLTTAETAFRTGRGSQADVFGARAAVVSLEDRLSLVDRQLRSSELTLIRWLGADAQRVPLGAPLWQTAALGTTTGADHFSQQIKALPQAGVLEAQVHAAEVEARLAEANKKADWTWELAFSQRGPSFSNMISFGFSFPLQWDQTKRQNRELGAKLALVKEAEARYDDLLRSHEAELRVMQNDWQNGKDRVARYIGQMVPLTRQRSDAALAVYRSGKSDLAAVLAARRDEIDMRVQAITVELETARLWAQLNFLIPDRNTAATH